MSSRRPLLVDGCCGAGGASMGYSRAGFEVVGWDLVPQPNYPFEFVQGDVLQLLMRLINDGNRLPDGRAVHALHASVPCQPFSPMSACRPGLAAQYPDLIGPVRDLLVVSGLPYVMENVMASPLRADLMLCGQMFGRALYRHRKFESNLPLRAPKPDRALQPQECGWDHPVPASRAGHWTPGTIISVAGHVAPVSLAREVMDIDWTTREELCEAIPPYYAEHVGAQVLAALTTSSQDQAV